MGQPTFDSRNSKTSTKVLGLDQTMIGTETLAITGFGFPVIKRRYEASE